MNDTYPESDPAAGAAQRRLAWAILQISSSVGGMAAELSAHRMDIAEQLPEPPPLPGMLTSGQMPAVPDIIANLFQDTFGYLTARHGVDAVSAASEILEQALELVCNEIFFVSDELLDELKDETDSEP